MTYTKLIFLHRLEVKSQMKKVITVMLAVIMAMLFGASSVLAADEVMAFTDSGSSEQYCIDDIDPDEMTMAFMRKLADGLRGSSSLYTTYGVYLRTSPEYSSSNKICLIARGKKVTLVSEVNSSWYKVRYNGKVGYAPAKYLRAEEQGVIRVNTTCALKLHSSAEDGSGNVILTMSKGASVRLVKKISNKWYKVNYNGTLGYARSKYLTAIEYPLVYRDGSMTVTVNRTWYKHAYVYTAHIQTTNYKRFGTYSANNKWNSFCTPSTAAKQINAIVLTNGDYSSNYGAAHASGGDDYGTAIARRGRVLYDHGWYGIGLYNYHNGKLFNSRWVEGYHGCRITDLVNEGKATDTFNFFWSRPVFEGRNMVDASGKNSTNRRPRTFVGTNGKAGDIWICVADGDHRDGKSVGLNPWEVAQFLIDKCHCTFGVGLDGGGSSAFIYNGVRLTGGSKERSVCDFVFIR